MSKQRELTDTVWEFLDRVGPMYAQLEENIFRHEMHANCLDALQSPIEDLFYIACYALCRAAHTELNPEPYEHNGVDQLGRGVFVRPQVQIDKYRVDFLLSQNGIGPSEVLIPVIVELDGHDFHDRDKRQRSYEKARDRHLQRAGFRVIHFTGSDVVKDPFACAHEALHMVGAFDFTELKTYNPKDPLGLESAV